MDARYLDPHYMGDDDDGMKSHYVPPTPMPTPLHVATTGSGLGGGSLGGGLGGTRRRFADEKGVLGRRRTGTEMAGRPLIGQDHDRAGDVDSGERSSSMSRRKRTLGLANLAEHERTYDRPADEASGVDECEAATPAADVRSAADVLRMATIHSLNRRQQKGLAVGPPRRRTLSGGGGTDGTGAGGRRRRAKSEQNAGSASGGEAVAEAGADADVDVYAGDICPRWAGERDGTGGTGEDGVDGGSNSGGGSNGDGGATATANPNEPPLEGAWEEQSDTPEVAEKLSRGSSATESEDGERGCYLKPKVRRLRPTTPPRHHATNPITQQPNQVLIRREDMDEGGHYWDPFAGGGVTDNGSSDGDGGRFWEDRERRGMGGAVSSLASMSLSRSTLGSSGGVLSAGGTTRGTGENMRGRLRGGSQNSSGDSLARLHGQDDTTPMSQGSQSWGWYTSLTPPSRGSFARRTLGDSLRDSLSGAVSRHKIDGRIRCSTLINQPVLSPWTPPPHLQPPPSLFQVADFTGSMHGAGADFGVPDPNDGLSPASADSYSGDGGRRTTSRSPILPDNPPMKSAPQPRRSNLRRVEQPHGPSHGPKMQSSSEAYTSSLDTSLFDTTKSRSQTVSRSGSEPRRGPSGQEEGVMRRMPTPRSAWDPGFTLNSVGYDRPRAKPTGLLPRKAAYDTSYDDDPIRDPGTDGSSTSPDHDLWLGLGLGSGSGRRTLQYCPRQPSPSHSSRHHTPPSITTHTGVRTWHGPRPTSHVPRPTTHLRPSPRARISGPGLPSAKGSIFGHGRRQG